MIASFGETGSAAPGWGPSATAARRPAQRSGRVMLSGKSWWSMSMPVSAISAQVTGTAHAAAVPKPKCQATQADKMPVASSTAG